MHLISFNFIVRAIDRDEFRITFSRDKDILTIQGKSFPIDGMERKSKCNRKTRLRPDVR